LGCEVAGAEHQKRGQLLGGTGAHRGILVGDFVGCDAGGTERFGNAVGIDES